MIESFMKNKKLKEEILTKDSIKYLKKIDSNSIDHCITDPPYNISNYEGKKEIGWYVSNKTWQKEKRFNKIKENWDTFSDNDYYDFTINWINEIKRVVKPNGNILIFGTYHNIYKIGYILDHLDTKIINSIIWYKRNAFPNITQRMLCESTEQIIWACNNNKKKAKNWVFNYETMKKFNPTGKQLRNMWDIPMTPSSEKTCGKHPSQKPINVIQRLIEGCTNKNEIVIDPFCGSGTVPLVCKMNERQYIGIDNNKDYIKIAKKRLKSILI